jgi:hypothetical protein
MKKITIRLNAQIAAWAQRYAARRNQSLSQLVDELLHSKMREYDLAMRRYLLKQPAPLNACRADYPSREDMHNRCAHEP